MSIRQRLYLSFLLLVLLFVVNAVITIITLNDNNRLSNHLTEVIEPSLQTMDDFKKMMVESKMYATNWVFLRSKQEDKDLLKELHSSGYFRLKERMNIHSSHWVNKNNIESLKNIFTGFEQLMAVEKSIMSSLTKFDHYNDPVIKLEAEREIEEEVLPRTASLMDSLNTLIKVGQNMRDKENDTLEAASVELRTFIIILAITIIGIGIFFSVYMTKVVISPIHTIRHIVNDLGNGITRKIDHQASDDEIGKMINSVNNLSAKIQATATFAHEVGLRNFDMPFKPLSEEDTLGKALIAMRENLKTGETSLEIKNRELERKNKELEQFAYVASHDLQEPLRTTSSFAELLQQQYKGRLDGKADKYLSYIVQASERMGVFITDLLEYSRIGSKKELKQVDCNRVLNEVLADLDSAILETGAEIKAGTLPVIYGYQTEIKQLFQNLTINAIKFRQKNIPPRIKISACREKDNWRFAFADNGIGIAKEHNERIFIIFQRLHTRNEYPGSGIGLSHCKKIVELHKGKIWLESEPGQGTTFYFTIPQNNT